MTVKQAVSPAIFVTVHYDRYGREWVLRLQDHDAANIMSIGGLVGEDEAKAVQAVLQGALELLASCGNVATGPEDASVKGFWRGMNNANKIVEGNKLVELFRSAGH